MKLIHAGRWYVGIGDRKRAVYVGISRVTTLSGRPLGWVAGIDSQRFNRVYEVRVDISRKVARYRW